MNAQSAATIESRQDGAPAAQVSLVDHWIFQEYDLPARSLGLYRIIFSAILLMLGFPRWLWITSFDNSFYRPPLGLMSFSSGFPPVPVLYLLELIGIACTVFLLFGLFTRWASLAVAVTLLVGNSIDYSFGKINHDVFLIIVPALMSFSRWGDACSIDAIRRPSPPQENNGWPLAMIAMLLGCAMMFATQEKLRGGWLDPHRHAVYQYLLTNYSQSGQRNLLSNFALDHTPRWLWKLQDLMTIPLEAGFLFAAIRLRYLRFVLAVACLFHFAIGALFEIPFWFNIITYAAFVDWSFLESWKITERLILVADSIAPKIKSWQLLFLSAFVFLMYCLAFSLLPDVVFPVEPMFLPAMLVCGIGVVISLIYFLGLFDAGVALPTGVTASEKTRGLLDAENPLILFDGVCGLCSAWVDFVMRFDRRGKFLFTPLQGPAAQNVLKDFGLPVDYLDSILLISNAKLYRSSEAILQILRQLPFPFPVAYPLIVIPGIVRDAVYQFIAAHRYRWFGKKETCRMPLPEERARFILDD